MAGEKDSVAPEKDKPGPKTDPGVEWASKGPGLEILKGDIVSLEKNAREVLTRAETDRSIAKQIISVCESYKKAVAK